MPQGELQWNSLTDFTPGIYSQTARSYISKAGPFKLGSAQELNTFRCCALPNGGLAPLPKRVHAWSLPAQASVVIGPKIIAFEAFALNQSTTGFPDELHYGVLWYTTGNYHLRWFRQRIFSDDGVDALKSLDGALLNTAFADFNFATSRMHPTTPTLPGVPIMAFAWFGQGVQFTSVFPPPAAPATTAVLDLDTTRLLKVLGHQGRLVVFEDVFYGHGAGGFQVDVDEQISFTDPPNSTTLGAQNEVFVPENPYGYGAYGSVSAGELFIVKRKGGGVIVSGDIADPTITRLPGVVSTGRWACKAASSPNGLFYGGADGGCYVWRGADTSTKVSNQLRDDFLVEAGQLNSTGYQIQMADWLEWVVCSNSWLYDTVTESWWRLDDPSFSTWGFSRSFDARYMYASRSDYVNGGEAAYAYDRTTPANSFSWQSHPIPVSTDHAIDVREVVVRAQGTGTVTITLTPFSTEPAPVPVVYTFASPTVPQMIRQKFRAQGENITIRIQSDSGDTVNPAPIIYEVRLGYIQAMHGPES